MGSLPRVGAIFKGGHMALRHIFCGAAAAAFLVSSVGCVGPIKDRLVVEEWKSKRDHPIQVEKDWVYEGEHWEHAVSVDRRKAAEDWTGTTVGYTTERPT